LPHIDRLVPRLRGDAGGSWDDQRDVMHRSRRNRGHPAQDLTAQRDWTGCCKIRVVATRGWSACNLAVVVASPSHHCAIVLQGHRGHIPRPTPPPPPQNLPPQRDSTCYRKIGAFGGWRPCPLPAPLPPPADPRSVVLKPLVVKNPRRNRRHPA